MFTGSSRSRLLAAPVLAFGIVGCAENPAPNEPPLPPPAPPVARKSSGKKVQGPADLVTKPPRGGAAK